MSATANRFRSQYRELSKSEENWLLTIKEQAEVLAQDFENAVIDPRMKALALTNLEQAVMWAVKGITG